MRRMVFFLVLLAIMMVLLVSCGGGSSPSTSTSGPDSTPPPLDVKEVRMRVFQSPQCGCCGTYGDYLREEGFKVEVTKVEDMASVKRERQVPQDLWSCHTVEAAGYFIEGHVPAAAIEKLLTERPAITGIALPGMPAGAPGMGGEKKEPFSVYAASHSGASLFMTY